jgi:putative salt-induced outer membrane protein YdiY
VRATLAAFAVALAAVAAPLSLSAQKADTVVLRNGDRIVGEIKFVDRGALSYKTDDMGTLAIKWDKIRRIISYRYFEVEVTSGLVYYGQLLQAPNDGQIIVAVSTFSDTLPQTAIVRINPIGRSFLSRVDGHLSIGFTYQRANRLWNLSGDFAADYRTRQWLTQLTSNAYFQDEEASSATSRSSVALQQQRFLTHRWLLLGSGQLEHNEELDLDFRALLTGGGGRFLIQTPRSDLLLGSGLVYTNERFTASSVTGNLELLVTFVGEYFQLDSPKSDLQATLSLYPNLTDFGRVRSDLEINLSHEFIKDFMIGVTMFDKFDSRPPSATAAKNDYGVTFSIGWTF